jgi:hypothetical protein
VAPNYAAGSRSGAQRRAAAILFFTMRLINDERLTGSLKNAPTYNLLGWGTFALVTSAVAMMLGTQLLKMRGGL